jgi:hypothetical protein
VDKRLWICCLILAGCGAPPGGLTGFSLSPGEQRHTGNTTRSGPAPVTSSVSGNLIDVEPSSSALTPLQAALTAVPAGSTITLHPGNYTLSPPSPTGSGGALALLGNGVGNFTLNGNGARLVVTNPEVGLLSLRNCSNITLENFTLDYDPLPFTQGTITAISGPTSFQVTLQAGFPSLSQSWFSSAPEKWGLLRDSSQPLRVKAGALNVYPLQTWQGSGSAFNITTSGSNIAAMAVGDTYVQLARRDGSAAFQASGCQSVTYQNITIHASPAAGFIALNSSQMVYRNNQIVPATGRFHSTCADGIFQVQGAVGPVIENNTISTNGDDGIIVKTLGGHAASQSGDHKTFSVQSATSGPFTMNVGDVLEVYDPQAGSLLGSGRIESLSGGQATLDTAIPGVTPECYFYNQNQCLSNFTVRGNQLISNRRWGIFCCSRNGLIGQNQVTNSNAQAVMLMNADQGMQDDGGLAPANVTIRNNTFTDCFLQAPGALSDIQGILSLVTIGKAAKQPVGSRQTTPVNWRGNRSISISNNTFDGFTHPPALSLQCADGVTVSDNAFLRGSGGPTVLLNNANNVTFSNNGLSAAQVQSNAANTTNVTGP